MVPAGEGTIVEPSLRSTSKRDSRHVTPDQARQLVEDHGREAFEALPGRNDMQLTEYILSMWSGVPREDAGARDDALGMVALQVRLHRDRFESA